MPRLKITGLPYYNNDGVASAIAPTDISNVYLDQSPDGLVLRRRPGMTLFANLGSSPGQGVFEWEAAGLVLAVSGGNVYTLSSSGAATDITTDALDTTEAVQFADGAKLDGTPYLYIANGKLVFSEDGANTVYPTDASTPTTADHVVYINLRFLANVPGTQQFLFTDTDPATGTLEPDYWSSSDNPLVAEAEGDNILGLWTFLQEVYAWGSNSLEICQDDGVTPFSPIPQASSNVGLEAKHSVAIADNTLFGLCVVEGSRCVVQMQGRAPVIISEAIANILADYTTVSDAVGQVISVGGTHTYLLQFPSENATWAYNMQSNSWVPWATGETCFIGQHSTYVKAWNKHLIMSQTDGKIYALDRSVNTDDDVAINAYRRTIWEDHGAGTRKRCDRLRVKIKKSTDISGSAYLRWADNGSEVWSNYKEIPLGELGSGGFIIDLPRKGMYKSRRYEVSITADAEFSLVWVEETVTALRF